MRNVGLMFVSCLALAACGDNSPGGAAPDSQAGDTAPPDTAPPPVCGNGVVEAGEICDEGASNGQYNHCSARCDGPGAHCGDGIVQATTPEGPELCDDGPLNGQYGRCGFGCHERAPHCGNSFIDYEHELCDDGPKNGTYPWCRTDCQGLFDGCGDGVVVPFFETCDEGPANGTPGHCPVDCYEVVGCGDGDVVAPEACDDGTLNGHYGSCASDCAGPGPRCGDGVRESKMEACDQGDQNGQYGACAADCKTLGARCGDGHTDAPDEVCDEGEAVNGTSDHCGADCRAWTAPWIGEPKELGDGPTDGASCSDEDILAKYFRYRLRFRGNGTAAYPGFIVIGEGPGRSMPASRRQPEANCAGYWMFERCPRPDVPDARGFYNWGDGTIWQGEYLAYLALEYAMFVDLGHDTRETLEDLRLALAAVDRVDEHAESFYPGVAPARDGFFVRDDVPLGFEKTESGDFRWPRDDGVSGYECVTANLTCTAPVISDGSYTSQDQSIALIWALGLIDALVPEDVVVGGVHVAADAREKVHRLVWHLRSHGWKVTDPVGAHPPDQWGGNAIGFSNHFAKAANFVVGDAFGVDDYRNFASRTAGEAAWTGLQAIWEATHGYNRTHALRLAALTGDWNTSKMPKMAMGDGKDYFALTYALIHQVELDAPFSAWRVESLLGTAPCGGPCLGEPGCEERGGWMSEARTTNPEDRFGSRHHPHAEFNGLDYLSMFAAWHLYQRGHWRVEPAALAPGESCSGYRGLDAILAAGASDGETWNPSSGCAAGDLQRHICGRPFGAWVADARRGAASIFGGGARWDCTGEGGCTLRATSDDHSDGDDLVLGTPGGDTLEGGDGNDCLAGFGGDDALEGNQGFDWLDGGDGNDDLSGEGAGLVLDGDGDVLHGGPGNDTLRGAPGKDELYGDDGDDTLDGGNGDDYLMGGDGNDALDGALGEDTLRGGPGDDALDGGMGDDILWAGAGRDKLDGEEGDDLLDGGAGPDFLRGGSGMDSLVSGDDWGTSPPSLDHDRMCGNGGDDTIWGGWDQDECLGGGWFLGGSDTVNGCDDDTASEGDCDNGAFAAW